MAAEPCTQLRVRCRGVVQGVGFRPALHRLAASLGLRGTIDNHSGLVQLNLWGSRPALEQWLHRLPAAVPSTAQVESIESEWLPTADKPPTDLRIGAGPAQALGSGWLAPALAPDRAPCAACRAELADPANRRYRYPLISCCDCGPRYSIATAEPFARAHTTLAGFPLCADCQREFDDPADRRFHAETISCPRCGPRVHWLALGSSPLGAHAADQCDPLQQALGVLEAGGIVALQGVGGFQLLVDAGNRAALERLRRRKRRPAKPLAVLVAELTPLEPWLQISPAERQALQGPEAPIVLLQRRRGALPSLVVEAVAPGSGRLGVMLPASPLHLLLAEAFGRPLVATSGNRSGAPLCHTHAEALAQLLDPAAPFADGLLLHDRAVVRPLDDSLLQCIDNRPQLLRRARGFAPLPLQRPAGLPAAGAVLALGGDFNAAPALALDDRVWLAPHQGDLSDGQGHDRWQRALQHLLERHGAHLETICSDRHPGYSSVLWARQCRRDDPRLRHCRVQHHQAHGLAVLAEHGLRPPALVVACDGLGYGAGDVPLWGGEGLWLDGAGRSVRQVCLRPFALPGAERAALEPRRAALGLLHSCGSEAWAHPGARSTRGAFAPEELALLQQALAAGLQCPLTSSAGRLLDALASLLGLVQVRSYDGQGGLLLQGAAEAALAAEGQGIARDGLDHGYRLPLVRPPFGHPRLWWWDWHPLLMALLADRAAGVCAEVCALRVHRAWIDALAAWVSRQPPLPVVLCGGCFQNRLLLEGAIRALRQAGRQPLWAQQLPPGDGGLALGQLLAARLQNDSSTAATRVRRLGLS